MAGLITLTTDFGMRDPYVGSMKGVIHRIAANVHIVDLTHDISPQDVLEAALFLATAAPHFPAGTVHVAVVDPGVGGPRRAIAAQAAGQVFVCPDNGILSLVEREYGIDHARAISNSALMREFVSATFHGRDVFAPVAAHLVRGVPMELVGEPAGSLIGLDVPGVEEAASGLLRGRIIHIDRFGNAISNVARHRIQDRPVRQVRSGGFVMREVFRTYSDVPVGDPVVLFGSCDFLEIAINKGNASEIIGLARGDELEVTLE